MHVLYTLQKQGLVDFKRKRGVDRPGINLTDIHLTPKGKKHYEEIRNEPQ